MNRYSPLVNIGCNPKLPAMMLYTGLADKRVDPSQTMQYLATAQQCLVNKPGEEPQAQDDDTAQKKAIRDDAADSKRSLVVMFAII